MALKTMSIPVAILLVFSTGIITPAAAAKVNCEALYQKNCHKDYDMAPGDVQQCILRGYDAPQGCRKNEGRSGGVNVQGASGFSYGAIEAPENSAGAVGAQPTTDQDTMINALGYNYKGGCVIFRINLCANGKQIPPPLDPNYNDEGPDGPTSSTLCAERDDPNNRIGAKQPLGASGVSLPCGGAVPLTNYEMTLNDKPDHLVVTEYRSYEMRVYQKVNGKYVPNGDYYLEYTIPNDQWYRDFSPIPPKKKKLLGKDEIDLPPMELRTIRVKMHSRTGAIPLPGYLCNSMMVPTPDDGDMPKYQKTTELTPTIAQMITYNNLDKIILRLMSRNTIKPDVPYKLEFPYEIFGYPVFKYYFFPEPPEEEIESDEKFLVLPTFMGLPVIPAGRFPVVGHEFEQILAIPPAPPGVIPDGRVPPSPFYRNQIVIDGNMPPPDACASEPYFFMKPGRLSGDILIESPTTLCEGSEEECAAMKAKCEQEGGDDCDTISIVPAQDQSCDIVKLPLQYPDVPMACNGKMQYVVLDRHNLVYPPGANPTMIAIDGWETLMAPSVEGSRVFTQKDTILRLGLNAPPVTLNEGGTLLMKNGDKIKLFPPGTIDVGRLNLTGGGLLIDNKGKLVRSYAPNTNLNIVDRNPQLPYLVNVNRSFTLPYSPNNFVWELPTQSRGPFAKLPLEAPPVQQVPKTKPEPTPYTPRRSSNRGPR